MITIDEAIGKIINDEHSGWEPDFPWSKDKLAEIENSLEYSRLPEDEKKSLFLPDQLKRFFLGVGMCGGSDDAFLVRFESGAVAINETQVIGARSPERIIKNSKAFLPYYYGENRDKLMPGRVPNGYIFMGTAEGGHAHLLMDGTNPDNNAVYIWGLAYDPWGEGDNTMGIGKCADTLAEFLYNLQPRENL